MSSRHEIVTSLPFWRTTGKALLLLFLPAILGAAAGGAAHVAFGLELVDAALLTIAGLFAGLVIMLVWLVSASRRSPGGLRHGLPNMTTVPLIVDARGLSGALTLAWADIAQVRFIAPKQSTTLDGATARPAQERAFVPQWGATGIEDREGATHLLSAAGVDKNRALYEALEQGLKTSKV